MEKLIELLNERLSTSDLYDFYDKIYYKEYCGGDVVKIMARIRDKLKPTGDRDADMTHLICLKKYEFIKWLVDNDKIDKKKFENKFFVCGCCGYKILSTRETCEACGDEVLNIYEALLMRLSIQDEPLTFLISVLK